jgi:Tfp pilus assembly pilus retraction ATPase PilT
MAAIDQLLRTMLEKGGSDLHLTVGLPPKSRISGSLQTIGDTPLDARTLEGWLKEICPEKRWLDFLERRDLDLAHEVPGLRPLPRKLPATITGARRPYFGRFRPRFLSFEDLKLPEALKKLCHLDQGLVVGHGPDRQRQVDHPRGDDRLHQFEPRPPHHHHRGPDRVRPPGQEIRDRAPRGGRAHRVVRRRR